MTGEEDHKKSKPKAKALPPPAGHLTVDEAGAYLRVRRRRIAYLIARKQLRSAKIGGRRLVRLVDLDAYVAENMSDTTESAGAAS